MTPRSVWRRWTEPSGSDPHVRRREAMVLNVLAAFVVLSIVLQALQWARFAFGRPLSAMGWWLVNVAVCGLFLWLMRVTRARGPRTAATGIVSLVGFLAVLLLLADGPDRPMWVILACAEVILAITLIGTTGAVAAFALTSSAVVIVVALFGLSVIEPFSPDSRTPSTLGGILGVVAVMAFLAFVAWLYARTGAALHDPVPATAGPELARVRTATLSAREVEVVQLVAAGRSNDRIAEELVLSPRTVQTHVANAMRKAQCANRTELGVLAIREGLVPLAAPPEPADAGPQADRAR